MVRVVWSPSAIVSSANFATACPHIVKGISRIGSMMYLVFGIFVYYYWLLLANKDLNGATKSSPVYIVAISIP